MQISQENFTTTVNAKFEEANRVHYGQFENIEYKKSV